MKQIISWLFDEKNQHIRDWEEAHNHRIDIYKAEDTVDELFRGINLTIRNRLVSHILFNKNWTIDKLRSP